MGKCQGSSAWPVGGDLYLAQASRDLEWTIPGRTCQMSVRPAMVSFDQSPRSRAQ